MNPLDVQNQLSFNRQRFNKLSILKLKITFIKKSKNKSAIRSKSTNYQF